MQFDVRRFLADHPAVQPLIEELEAKNAHFAKLLQSYYDISDDVPGEAMEDLALDQKKKERLAIKDELIEMLKKAGADL